MTLNHFAVRLRSAWSISAAFALLFLLAGCGNGFLFTGDHTGKDNYALKITPEAPVITVKHSVQLAGTSPWGGSPLWSVLPTSAGAVDGNGMFTAGSSPATGTIVAMWKQDVRYTASATFKIVAAPVADVTVTSPTLTVNTTDTASVPVQPGSTYLWTITGGVITSGQGTAQIQFTSTTVGTVQLTAKVTNEAGDPATGQGSATAIDLPPAIAYLPSSDTIVRGKPTPPIRPVSTGGAPVTFSISPGLPAGLVFDPATGQISGTATSLSGAQTFTITATNSGGSTTASLTLNVVDAPPVIAYVPSTVVLTNGKPTQALVPVSTGGAVTSWSIAGTLPAGLAFDPATGIITGTPTALAAAATYTVTASNSGGSATAALQLSVVDPPPVIAYNPTTKTFTRGVDIGSIVPTNTGGPAVSWQISTPLPPGLTFNTSTGVITGTPTTPTPKTINYSVTASNSGGTSNTVTLTYGVIDSAPVFSFIPPAYVVSVGSPVSPIVPVVTHGTVATWSINSPLPSGLSFDPATGTISGTPTGVSSVVTYTVTGTDSFGTSSTAPITITVVAKPTAAITASTLTPLYGAAVAVTPTFANAVSAGVGTSRGASDLSAAPVTGVAINSAPITSPQTFWLRATDAAGDAQDASVTVTPQTVVVGSVTPAGAHVSVNGTATFSATVTGGVTNTLVWTVSAGVINPNTGVWTAPASPGPVVITATSKDDPTKSASTTVNVVTSATSLITASTTTPLYGASITVTPSFTGAVQASVGTTPGGSNISTAPVTGVALPTSALTTPTTFWLRTTNAAGDSQDSSVLVTPQTVAVGPISPSAPTRTVSSATTFSATATGGVTNGLTWSASAGTIDPNTGVWTAPATAQQVTITATSKDDSTKSATTVVSVVAAGTSQITASNTTPLYGATVTVTPTFTNAVTAVVGTTRGGSNISSAAVTGVALPTSALTAPTTFWLHTTNAAGDSQDSSVLVTPQTVAVGPISPSSPTRTVSSATTFSATATGGVTNGLTWSASAGTIDPNTGAWTAPATAQQVTITATSKDDLTKSATTVVSVVAAGTSQITASTTTPLYGATVTVTPTFTNAVTAVVGTTRRGSNISSAAVTGVALPTSALTTPTTFWLHTTNAAGDSQDSSVLVTPQTVAVGPISPSSPARTVSSVTTFSATATGGVTNGLTWSASAGTIDPNTGAWTAPATAQQVTITATSKDDPTKSATTVVSVVAAGTSLITASTTTPLFGATVTLTPTFTNAVTAVIGTTRGGSDISAAAVNGVAILTAAITTPETYWLHTTNAAGDASDTSVTVTPQTVAISPITPAAPTRTVGTSTTFTATATGGVTNGLTWTATGGVIDPATGIWTAPATTGPVTIKATSKDDPSKSVTTVVNVVASASAAITASTTSPLFGATVVVTPTFSGGTNASVGTARGASDLSTSPVSGAGIATAPLTTPHTFWLRVTNAAGDPVDVSVLVTPQTVVVGPITPAGATRTVGTTTTFSAIATGGLTNGLTWSASGGSINPNTGVWNAPPSATTASVVTITATSKDDPTKSSTTTVTVVSAGTAFITASTTTPLYGASVTVTPTFTNATSAVVGTTQGGSDISASPVSGVSFATPNLTAPKTYWLHIVSTGGEASDVSVTVTPQTVVVNPIVPAAPVRTVNTATAFSTTATGGLTNSLTWTATGGTINANTGAWTAPATTGSVVITATAKDDTSKSASTTVTVYATPTASISASTNSPLYGATVNVTPTFAGAATASVGTLVGASDLSGAPVSGTALATGVLTSPTTFWLRATNTAGTSIDVSTLVTPKTVAISAITPTATRASVGYTVGVNATVTNAVDTSVNWTANGGTFSAANTASGVNSTWTAPATAGTYTLTATSSADPTKHTTVSLTVVALPSAASLTASNTSPLFGATITLTPVFTGGTGSVDQGVGTVTSGTAKTSAAVTVPTTFHLTVTNTAGQTASSASALVTPQTVSVDPPTATQAFVTTSLTQAFAANVRGAFNTAVTWSANGGSFSGSTWTAPSTTGTYTITATSVADPTKSNSTTVTVVNPPTLASFIATDPILSLNHATALTAVFTNGAGTVRVGTAGTGSSDIASSATSGVSIPTGSLTATTVFTITVYNEAGNSTTGSVTVTVVAGASSPTASLSGPRYAHTSTLLPDGRVLITGGRSDAAPLNTSQIYDPTAATFADAGTMASSRFGHTATLLANNTVLVAGGNNGSTTAGSELWSGGSFTATAAMNSAREKQTATLLLNGNVLIVGGLNGGSPVVTAELYNPSTGAYTYTAGNLNTARYSHTATLLANGKVLIAGGYNGSLALKTAEIYDPSTGAFTVVGSMASARQRHAAVLLSDGTVALIGGQGTSAPLTSAEIFNSTTNAFTTTAGAMASARDSLSATLIASGKVIVAGGIDGSANAVKGSEIFDPTAGTFGLTAVLSTARAQHSATLLQNGQILLVGGLAQSGASTAAELIDPQDGLTPYLPAAAITAPLGATRAQTGLVASVPSQTHVEYVWMITGGTITGGLGTNAVTFSMPSSGTATLDVLVVSDRIVPSHMQFVVTPKPVISSFLPTRSTVTAGSSTSLNWTVSDATSLSIDQSVGTVTGTSTGVTVGSLGTTTYTLTASNAGGSVTATTSILAVPPPIAASLTAAASTVPVGGNTTLTPIFSQGTGVVSPGIGSVASGPAYPTPAISVPSTFTLVVTNAAGDTAQQTVSIGLQPVAVTGISGPAYITSGRTAAYTASVTGSVNTGVTWQTTGGGSIDATGHLTAPAGIVTQTPITLTATSVNGGTPATMTVQVVPLPSITSFTATPTSVNYGAAATITPVFTNGTGQIAGLGSVSSGQAVATGTLTAAKTFTLTVTNLAGDSVSQDVTVNLGTPSVSTPTPSNSTVSSGDVVHFSATTSGSANSAVTWSANGGTFSGSNWTAPSAGTYTITASSVSPTGYSASTQITVVNAPVIATFTATPLTVSQGASTTLLATFSNGTAVISPGGTVPVSGTSFSSGALSITTSYTLTVTNTAGKSVTRSLTVNVIKGITSGLANMAVSRVGHTVTLLADGTVLVAGGTASTTAELFNAQTQALTTLTAPMQAVRYYPTATLLADGRVLLTGGSNGSVSQGTAELYNPSSGIFTASSGTMVQPRSKHTAALMPDGRVLLSGGVDAGGVALTTAEIYNPVTDSFSAAPAMSAAREFGSATVLGSGSVLVAGGDDTNNSTNSAQVFNGSSYTAATLTEARTQHTATSLSTGNVFLAGGLDGGNATGSTELFNGTSFTASASLSTARYGHNANLLAGGGVLVLGGSSDGAAPLANEVIFDTVQAQFIATGDLTVARFQPASTIVRTGKVLIAGGSSNPGSILANPLNTIEIYDPQDSLTPVLPSATLTAPANAPDNTTGLTASVPSQSNVRYVWSLTNGTITSGLNTRSITFSRTTGPSVLSVLVISDRQVPVQSTVIVNAAPAISAFTATPSTSTVGLPMTLAWTATGGTGLTLTIDHGVGDVTALGGSTIITTPATNTTYTLTATDANGTTTRTVTVTAIPMPVATSLTAAVNPIQKGSSTTIVPVFTTNGSASINNGIGTVVSGVAYPTGNLTASTVFTLSVVNSAGTIVTRTLSVNVMTVVVGAISGPANVTVGSSSANYSAAVTGAVDTSVTWSTSGGSITSTGHLTAPATTGDIVVTATSNADPTQHNQTTVHVVAAPAATGMTAAQNPVLYGGSTTITPQFPAGTGTINQGIGAVSSGVAYTTGTITASKTFTLTVTNAAGDTASFPFTVDVQTVVVGAISGPVTVTQGHSASYSAVVTGAANTSVSWSSAGAGSWSGSTWTAPSTPGTYTLTATAVNGATNTLAVTVVLAPSVSSFTAAPIGVNRSQSSTLAATFAGAGTGSNATGVVTPGNLSITSGGAGVSTGALTTTQTYTLTVTNDAGDTATAQTTVQVFLGQFSATSNSLTPARALPTATLRADGNVLVSGGGTGSNATDLFDATALSFTSATPLQTGRSGQTSTLLPNGLMLIAGGTTDGSTALATAELYNPADGSFTLTGTLNQARRNHRAFLLDSGKVLLLGGTGLSSAELYDPATGAFTVTGAMASVRDSATASRLPDGRILVAGGSNGSSRLATAEIFDPGTNSFSTAGSMLKARQFHTATTLPSGQILFAGGTGDTSTGSAELFNPSQQRFTAAGDMIQSRQEHVGVLLAGGMVLLAGGNSGVANTAIDQAELFDPSQGTFLKTDFMSTVGAPTTGAAATILPSGKVLVTGGTSNGTAVVAGSELYTPTDGLTAAAADATLTAPAYVAQAATAVAAHVTAAANARYIWMVSNGTLVSGQGTPSVTFNMGATGNATLDVLIVTDRLVPSHGHAVVVGEPAPVITSFTAAASPVLYGSSTSITPVFTGATAGSVIGTGAAGSSDVTASAATGVAVPVGPLTAPVQYRLTITNRAGVSSSQTLTVNVSSVIVSAISPANPFVSVNGARTFAATVSQAVNTGIVWSATGGTIDPVSGAWTAPAVAGSYTIKATAAADGTTFVATTATVVDLPAIQSFTASSATVNYGAAGSLTPVFTGALANKASIGTSGANSTQLSSTAVSGTALSTGALTANTTYTLTVTNAAGASVTATAQVAVNQPFSATGPMALARSGESMTLLPDGTVLVAGGTTAAGQAEVYTTGTGSFALMQAMQAPRRNHTATLLATGQVLLTGGADGSGAAQNTAEIFDPTTGTFAATSGVMGHARLNHTAALLPDGRVLIAGGFNATENQLASAEIFDPATGTFSAVATSMTSARTQATATTLSDGRVLVAGGFNGTTQLATAEVFVNGAFGTPVLAMGSARSRHTATLLPSGQVLLSGGVSGAAQLATAVLFTPGTPDSFNAVGSMSQARQDATATLLANGKVLVSGGSFAGTALGSAEIFTLTPSTFTTTGNLITPRASASSVLLLDGTALVAGGTTDGTTPLLSAERFNPQDGVTPFQPDATIVPSVSHAYPATTGLTATVPAHAGNRFVWSVRNGTITGGQGTGSVTFSMAGSGDAVLDALVLSDHLVPAHSRVTVAADPLPVLTSFTAGLNPVPYGGSTTLTPVFSNATGVMLGTGGSGSSDLSSSVTSGSAIAVGPLTAATSYTLTFPTIAGTQITQTLTVNVLPVQISAISPGAASVTAGHTQAFAATVTQAANTGVTWTATGGTISAAGVWTAPATTGTYTIRATAVANGTTFATTTATVVTLPTIQSFTASVASVSRGQAATLTPVFTADASSHASIGISGAGSTEISSAAASGSAVSTGALTATTTFTLTVTNGAGDSATQTVLVTVTQPFSSTGAMALARQGQTTTPLPDGTVLVAGGTTAADVAEIYTEGAGTFTATTAMQAARKGHTATLLADGRILMAGGFDGTNALTSAEIFDPATHAFTAIAGAMVHARQHHAATLLPDGRVLLVGGSNPTDQQLASAEIFDPATGSFTAATSSLVTAREFATLTAMSNGDVLVTGGSGAGGTALNSAELYSGGVFGTQSFLMRSARTHHTATLLPSGQVLLAGGSDGLSPLGSAEMYTGGSTNASFTAVSASMSTARQGHTAILLAGGKVLLAGGDDGTAPIGSGEMFDPAAGTFAAAGNLVTARTGAGAAMLGSGKVLIVGGTGASSTPLPSAELFDPADGVAADLPGLGLTAPSTAAFGSTQTASITLPAHARCVWSVAGGTVASGAGRGTITFVMGATGNTTVHVLVVTGAGLPEAASQVVTGH